MRAEFSSVPGKLAGVFLLIGSCFDIEVKWSNDIF